MNRKIMDAVLWVLVIVVVCFLFYTYNFMKSNAKSCLDDPIIFMEEMNEGAECNCWKDGVSYKKDFITPITITKMESTPENWSLEDYLQ